MACGCDGGAGGASSAPGGGGWTLRLPNGAHVGTYPTRAVAEAENRRVYNGAGIAIQR